MKSFLFICCTELLVRFLLGTPVVYHNVRKFLRAELQWTPEPPKGKVKGKRLLEQKHNKGSHEEKT